MTQLNSRFSNSVPLRHVKTYGAFHIYKRQPNQTAVYFLIIGGQIKHQGSRKHVFAKFMSYVRNSIVASISSKTLAQLKELQA
tara:strand:+ start:445 stop:693 length:249 start_codon:yes stop_codon:yes gene_type:complete